MRDSEPTPVALGGQTLVIPETRAMAGALAGAGGYLVLAVRDTVKGDGLAAELAGKLVVRSQS